jgi:uncharacterized protein (DUF488 family)
MATVPIYTIGHSTRLAEDFLHLLKSHGIQYLVDVRSVPKSRFNPQYNQKALQQFLSANGIAYVFMGDTLGGRPQDPACYSTEGKIDYAKVKRQPFFLEGIARLKNAHQKNLVLALMCSEGKPQECHRSRLIGEVLREQQLELKHIDEKGLLKTQEEVMRLTTDERSGNLF